MPTISISIHEATMLHLFTIFFKAKVIITNELNIKMCLPRNFLFSRGGCHFYSTTGIECSIGKWKMVINAGRLQYFVEYRSGPYFKKVHIGSIKWGEIFPFVFT